MLGTTLSHYRIVEKIGEGGMGEVYLAEDLKLQRKVALKFLSAAFTADPDRKRRFLQEARAAATIEHPNVAVIHEIDEAEGRIFIAMEYVRGKSLRDLIGEKPLTLSRTLSLAREIADGLDFAHERSVVHRDLKPENLLVSEQGHAKIIDQGLARQFTVSGGACEKASEGRKGGRVRSRNSPPALCGARQTQLD